VERFSNPLVSASVRYGREAWYWDRWREFMVGSVCGVLASHIGRYDCDERKSIKESLKATYDAGQEVVQEV
jgi:hypothetical protein